MLVLTTRAQRPDLAALQGLVSNAALALRSGVLTNFSTPSAPRV